MRQAFHSQGLVLSLLLIFLLFSHTTRAARLLQPKEGNEEVRIHEASQGHSGGQEEGDDVWNVMGMEKCEDGDVECLKRRMLADAHLDYIYTQHHKP
ncbi:putative phytosulfokines 6 [Cinnamomum micranthum f. kanehirae]|uniref:Phytosulfokine n=1 Tax=Cinnamomum micranthum f. kanehirae TaxID=337451 RepID=A0A443NV57_9MAGN|nr:putative phytosulfokines 6 [Cinnamomum micranthum f. kanehirae]